MWKTQVTGVPTGTGERSEPQPPRDRPLSFKAAAVTASAFWTFSLVQLHLSECPQLYPFGL